MIVVVAVVAVMDGASFIVFGVDNIFKIVFKCSYATPQAQSTFNTLFPLVVDVVPSITLVINKD